MPTFNRIPIWLIDVQVIVRKRMSASRKMKVISDVTKTITLPIPNGRKDLAFKKESDKILTFYKVMGFMPMKKDLEFVECKILDGGRIISKTTYSKTY